MTDQPRIRLPKLAKKGEVVQIRTLVSHVMESGQRRDANGRPIPRMIINRFTCTFNGRPVFACDIEPALAANPYLEFWARVEERGPSGSPGPPTTAPSSAQPRRSPSAAEAIATMRRRRLLPSAIAAVAVTAADGPLRAQDLEFGRYLANECMTCHRTAIAGAAIPNIFGMATPRFVTLLKAYREKELPNPVMQNVAGRLKDDEIAALAAYFAATKRP